MSQDPNRKRDVIDPELAKQMAWRVPSTAAQEPKEPEPAKATPDPEAAKAFVEATHRGCSELAEDVRSAWALGSPSYQVIATRNLLRRAQRLGLSLVGMQDHPQEAIRLFRLVAQHSAVLPISSMVGFSLTWLPLSARQPELEDLIVEVVLSNNGRLLFALDRGLDREELGGRFPRLGARLAEIVDKDRRWDVRASALRLLSVDEFPDAIPTLRRALRLPHVKMRYFALHILMQMKGDPITDEDVVWLLEDAVAHPIGRRGLMTERTYNYENALIELLHKKAPPNAYKILEVIADGGGEHIARDREGLGPEWALMGLAAAYPERALSRIDHNLLSPDAFGIYRTIDAMGQLPKDLARPRLLRASGLTDSLAIECVRRAWLRLFGDECPMDPLALVPMDLLLGPPSERMLSRLTVLRGKVDQAAQSIIEVLIDEGAVGDEPPMDLDASQREALALLMTAIRCRSVGYGKSLREWSKLLYRRFGWLAFDTMVKFAEDGVRLGVRFGWISALLEVARDFPMTEAHLERLRGLVRVAVASPSPNAWYAASLLLSTVGVPLDLIDRLLDFLLVTERESFSFSTAHSTADALAKLTGTPELDARITRELENAWRKRQWDACEHLMRLAVVKKVPEAIALTRKMIESYEGDVESYSALNRGFFAMRLAKLISDEEMIHWLGQPGHLLFSMAAGQVRKGCPEEMMRLLVQALDSKALGGAEAALAARALVYSMQMRADDARLEPILSAAPEYERVELCDTLLFDKVPLATLRHHLKACLLSQDERVALHALDILYMHTPDGYLELFEEVLPLGILPEARDLLLNLLDQPNEAALYWKDRDDDEEDEDDEDDEDDELGDEGDDEIPQGDA